MRRIVGQRERNEYWQRTAAPLPQLLGDAFTQVPGHTPRPGGQFVTFAP